MYDEKLHMTYSNLDNFSNTNAFISIKKDKDTLNNLTYDLN